ncbi:MAG: hypothetical protein KDC61_11545 [Saprospiraceae bacterium]|nr:hypothetical protein [Saprospiraceae bacterium]MCB0575185.1 hypothetical protein [Saprospiraceae bacterium]MCB9354552.1 hypothetical protein [Lewinellaceae bacterium]
MKRAKTNPAATFLCIGHCCHDRVGEGLLLGGTASYAALAIKRLGGAVNIMTSVGADFRYQSVFEEAGIGFWAKPAARTTVFENIYRGTQRLQYLHERAETLFPADLPAEWEQPSVVLFCPIAAEVDFSLLQCFPSSLRAATVQGWLRQWDTAKRVFPKAMDWGRLAGLDLVIMSDADIEGFESGIPEIARQVPLLVITKGAQGAIVIEKGEEMHFPAFPVTEVDATGAGDTFAAAFLLRYAATRDLGAAVAYAHTAASFVVEGLGIDRLDALGRLDERCEQYRDMFG